jgi:FKBP-type peptidyl-prolyl cis-trans isomerase 2
MSEQEKSPATTSTNITDDCVVSFHYRLCQVNENGDKTDWQEQSFGKDPLVYLHGHDNVIPGLEEAMLGKTEGDQIAITLAPEQAYGARRENSVQRVPMKHLHLRPGQKKLSPGEIVAIKTDRGVVNALVVKAGKFNVDVDTNHPFAGKTLHYELEVLNVRAASPEEIAHRHVHGQGGHQH